jgi:hypothetical protein
MFANELLRIVRLFEFKRERTLVGKGDSYGMINCVTFYVVSSINWTIGTKMNKKIHNFGTGIQKEKALKTESRAEQ